MKEQTMEIAALLGVDATDQAAMASLEKLCTELPPAEVLGDAGNASVIERDDSFPEIGSWYWVPPADVPPADVPPGRIIRDNYQWLGCVMKQGSNYVELHAPSLPNRGSAYTRVHLNEFHKLIFEPNAKNYFQKRIKASRDRINTLLGEIKDITARLGIVERDALPDAPDTSSMALAVVSSQDNIEVYKTSLITAKDKQLPDLFKQVKYENEQLAKWMSAEILPIQAASMGMESCIGEINNRIENIGLYAGLTEDVVLVKDGTPAPSGTILHLMQTRLYMDEESLVNYRHGGMDIQKIDDFDEWLSSDENMKRILPFERCAVSFRVRRNAKERETIDIASMFINIRLGELDKLTFLYVRNGEKVYRMNCDHDFGENLFPDRAMFNPGEPRMFYESSAKGGRNTSLKMMTKAEYDALFEQALRKSVARDTWSEHHSADIGYMETRGRNNSIVMDGNHVRYKIRHWDNPYGDSWSSISDRLSGWEPLDNQSVYYDDACGCIEEQIKLYNRVVLIIQGLFDRSEVLHPHPRVKLWDQDCFNAAIKLIYDGDMVIEYGKAPSFEEYKAKCNAKTDKNSVMIGQEDLWERKEAQKECDRMDRNWRTSEKDHRPTRLRPYGNEGPGYLAHMKSFSPKAKKCTFTWMRARLKGGYYSDDEDIQAKITIPLDDLFNVSAYVPGDFKKFFDDPRTRRNYLKWAPLLIAAEEYYAGHEKAQPQIPV